MFKHARARQQSGGGEAARARRGPAGPPGSTRAQCRRQEDTPPARAPPARTARSPRARAAPPPRPCTAAALRRAAPRAPAAMRRAGTAREPQPAAAPRSAGFSHRAHTARGARGAGASWGSAMRRDATVAWISSAPTCKAIVRRSVRAARAGHRGRGSRRDLRGDRVKVAEPHAAPDAPRAGGAALAREGQAGHAGRHEAP